MLLVLWVYSLLVLWVCCIAYGVVGVEGLSHYLWHYWWCGFVTLLVLLLVCHIASVVVSLSHCWSITLLPSTCLNPPPCVVIVVACVLARFYPHHHHLVGGEIMVLRIVIYLSLLGTHHCHLPPLVLLLVHCIISGVTSSLCCLCYGEVLPLPIALCK
jgi:hypothetical protein